MVGVDNSPLPHPALSNGHVEGVDDELRVLDGVDRPTHDPSTARVHHATTEDLPFSRSVLGDVRDPQFVQVTAGELALHEIVAGGHTLDPLHLRRARESGNASVVHERRHQIHADLNPSTLGELRVDPPAAVGAAGGHVDLLDECCQPLSAHHGRRHLPTSRGVVALGGHVEHASALLHGEPGVDKNVDHRVDPFGRRASVPSSSFARRRISTSASSSRIRRRARRSSLDSAVVRPGINP